MKITRLPDATREDMLRGGARRNRSIRGELITSGLMGFGENRQPEDPDLWDDPETLSIEDIEQGENDEDM